MGKRLAIFALLILSVALHADKTDEETQEPEKGRIEVRLASLRNHKGLIHCSLFHSKEGFPEDYTKAYREATLKADSEKLVFKFDDIPYGQYAIAVLHDENSNKKMDKNFWGIPKEGAGVSNNPEPRRGPPLYSEAVFTLKADLMRHKIKMRYP